MAAITIKFDPAGNPEMPTFVLAKPNGQKLGELNTATDFVVHDNLTSAAEFSLTVHKVLDDVECPLWDNIKALMLVWCREWDKWFQIDIDTEESDETVKHLTGTSLGEAELSQIYLYNIEINTESDILNDDYTVTTLYNSNNAKGSLLNRLMEKAPHYTIRHVASTIDNIQRSFSFDGTTIYDAFQEVADEIGCLFVFDNDSDDETDLPSRAISVYDLQTACMNDDCEYYQEYGVRYRGSFSDVCPKCGSSNLLPGYGEDTTILVSGDNLADTITKTPDTGSIKNCLKLVGGDDLMTAAIISCNPNGSQYIWYISDEMREMMSDELQAALAEYDELYYECKYTREIEVSPDYIDEYNALVEKYHTYDSSIPTLPTTATGFSGLMEAYYDTIDFNGYLQSELMPEVVIPETTAAEQIKILESSDINPVSLTSLTTGTSQATVESAIKLMVKAVIDSTRYSYEISTTSWTNGVSDGVNSYWVGTVTLTSETDDTDTATSSAMTITIDDDYENYIVQLIEKKNSGYDTDELTISALFALELTEFKAALSEYSLDYLETIADCCQGVLDVLVDYGCGEAEHELYDELYYPYYQKLKAIETEMDTRSDELAIIANVQEDIMAARDAIMAELDFEANLGETLWQELCMFRREDKYENDNYISEGLTNDELFANAMQFMERAEETLYQTATTQHSISTTLKNLLVIPEFQKIVEYFCVGNWIRVMIDDELFRLRLIEYEIDYNDLSTLQVEFSDVEIVKGGSSDLVSLMDSVKSMASSYDSLTNQVESNSNNSAYVSGWVREGLDVTNINLVNDTDDQVQIWDEHGLLLKKYNAVTDDYDSQQMKLVHRGLYITDDDWETVKTAVGNYYYTDPETGKLTSAYGVMAETLVGELILGESLGIYNSNGALTFDEDGLSITNGTNTFTVNPNDERLLVLSNADEDILYVDADGNLYINAESINTAIEDTVTKQITEATSSSVTNIETEFTVSSSSTELDDDCVWSTETPVKTTEKPYIWIRSVYTYGNGNIVAGDAVCISGADGTTVSSSTVTYQIGTSGSTPPDGDWLEEIPETSQGDYLWTKTVVVYSDGTSTTAYSVSYIGSDLTVTGYVVQYQTSTNGTTPPTGTWSSEVTATPGQFVWTKVTTYYSDGSETVSYSVSYIGQDGDTGRGVATITEYYAVTNTTTISKSDVTWYTDENFPQTTAENKYLWNYEEIIYTDGTSEETEPVIIGTYSEDGVGITKIEEYYALSTNATVEPDADKFSTALPTMTSTNKYLWNYEIIYYSDGTTQKTAAVIIGVYGDSATSLKLTASTYAVVYDENGEPKDSSAVTLEAIQQNYSDTITWTATGNSTGSITLSGTGTTRTLDVSAFDSNESVSITISAGDLSDTATIVKIQDGSSPVNIILTNEAHTFAGTSEAAIAASTSTSVLGYVGTTQTAVTINSVSGCPTGMTYTISGSGTTSASITFAVTTSMTTQSGTVTISCTCGDATVEKIFSYALALAGADGNDGVGISEVVEYYAVSSSNSTAPTTWYTAVQTMTSTNKYLWNYEDVIYTNGASVPTDPVVIGVYGEDGVGIEKVEEYYALSTSADEAPATSEFSTDIPTITETEKYLWNYEIIYYTDGSTSSTTPVIIGAYGDGVKSLSLTSSTYVVSYDESGEPKDNTAITLEATQQNYSDTITWTATGNSTGAVTLSGTGTTRTLAVSAFDNNSSVTVEISAGDLSDTVTIVKVQDGANSVNIILTNEAHTFAGTTDSAVAGSASTDVIGYVGVTQTAVTINSVTGCPTGMTYAISGNGTTAASITFSVTSPMTTQSGTVAISCTCGDVTIEKIFSYSLALAGADGNDGIGISGVTEYYAVSSSNSTAPTTWYTTVQTMTSENKYLWNYEDVLYTNGISISTDPVVIGVYGEDGVGIEDIEEYYALSTSADEAPATSEFSTDIPTITATEKYLWNYEIIHYTDGSTSSTTPVIIGAYGDSAKTLSLTTSAYVVPYDEYGDAKDTTAIALEAVQQNYSDTITWTATGSSSGAITLSGTGTTRTLGISNFDSNDSVTVEISAGGLSDTVTIVRVQDGGNAVNIVLTNEAHTFVGTSEAAITASTTTNVLGYAGTTQTAVTINSVSGCPTGMSYSIGSNGTTSASVTFSVTTSMVTTSGTVTISCTCNDVTINKVFSYALALAGQDGSDGVGISEVTEYYAVSSSSNTAPTTWYTTMQTMTATNKYLWNYEEIQYTDGSNLSTTPVIIGTYGEDGVGIESITEYYLASASATGVTTSTSGWTTSPTSSNATVSATKKYLWNYEVITYTDGSTSTTSPVIIGAYGDTGVGIESYVIYYYATTGTTSSDDSITVASPPDPNTNSSGWSTTQPDLVEDEYLWISYKITYTDGTVDWTSPTMLTDVVARETYTLISQQYNDVTETLEEYSRAIGDTDTIVDSNGNVVSIAKKLALIEATAEGITTTVSNLAETVEDIDVGGRNYIRNSQTMIYDYYSIVAKDDSTQAYVGSATVGTSTTDDGTVITASYLNAIESNTETATTNIESVMDTMGV